MTTTNTTTVNTHNVGQQRAWGTMGRRHVIRTWATSGVISHGEFLTAEDCLDRDVGRASGYSDDWLDEAEHNARGHRVRVAVYEHLPVDFTIPPRTRYGRWIASLYPATDCDGRKHGYWLKATWVASAEYSGTGEARMFMTSKSEAESTLRHFAGA